MSILDGLVEYWRLDEGSGSAIGALNGYNLIETSGTIAAAAGKVLGARNIAAVDSEAFVAADAPWNSITGDMTLCCWVKLTSLPSGVGRVIIAKFAAVGEQRSFFLQCQVTSNRFVFSGYADGTVASIHSATASNFGAAVVDTWYFISARHINGSRLEISVNGGPFNVSPTHTGGIFDSTAELAIGAFPNLAQPWDGLIDEVGLWNRVLTNAEIEWLYNSGVGRSFEEIAGISDYKPSQRVWAVIYGINGTTRICVLLNVTNASLFRTINEVGSWSLSIPAIDANGALLEVGQEVDIYFEERGIRLRGIVEDIDDVLASNGELVRRLSGLTLAAELLYQNTYFTTVVENLGQEAALDLILANSDNAWSSLLTGASYLNVTQRFDNMTLFEAAVRLATVSKAYVRETHNARELEIKNAYTASGIVITNRETSLADPSATKLAPISNVPSFKRDGKGLFNRVIPRGKASGNRLLDLSSSDRVTPYTINSQVDIQPILVDSIRGATGVQANQAYTYLVGNILLSGPNRCVIVFLSWPSAGGTLNWVKVAGVSGVSFSGPTTLGSYKLQGFYILNPPTGNLALEVNFSADGSARSVSVQAMSLNNVFQAGSPVRATATASGTSSTPSVAVGSAVDDIVLDYVHISDISGGTPATPGANQTELEDWTWNVASREAGAATVTMSWTLGASGAWQQMASSIRPASSYYIEDTTSVTTYRRRVIHLADVDFTSFEGSDLNIANTLYDYAVYYLQRHKDPIDSWTVEVAFLPLTEGDALLPGDSVQLIFTGWVNDISGVRVWKNVNQILIVLSIAESWDSDGVRKWKLTIATNITKVDMPESLLKTLADVNRLNNAIAQ